MALCSTPLLRTRGSTATLLVNEPHIALAHARNLFIRNHTAIVHERKLPTSAHLLRKRGRILHEMPSLESRAAERVAVIMQKSSGNLASPPARMFQTPRHAILAHVPELLAAASRPAQHPVHDHLVVACGVRRHHGVKHGDDIARGARIVQPRVEHLVAHVVGLHGE
eukprot:IDg16516t1